MAGCVLILSIFPLYDHVITYVAMSWLEKRSTLTLKKMSSDTKIKAVLKQIKTMSSAAASSQTQPQPHQSQSQAQSRVVISSHDVEYLLASLLECGVLSFYYHFTPYASLCYLQPGHYFDLHKYSHVNSMLEGSFVVDALGLMRGHQFQQGQKHCGSTTTSALQSSLSAPASSLVSNPTRRSRHKNTSSSYSYHFLPRTCFCSAAAAPPPEEQNVDRGKRKRKRTTSDEDGKIDSSSKHEESDEEDNDLFVVSTTTSAEKKKKKKTFKRKQESKSKQSQSANATDCDVIDLT